MVLSFGQKNWKIVHNYKSLNCSDFWLGVELGPVFVKMIKSLFNLICFTKKWLNIVYIIKLYFSNVFGIEKSLVIQL